MNKRRSATSRLGGASLATDYNDEAERQHTRHTAGESIPLHRLSGHSRRSSTNSAGISSTFSVDTPLMTTAADLDSHHVAIPALELNAPGPAANTGGRGKARTEPLNPSDNVFKKSKYPANVVSNNKYNFFTFLPIVLFEQFKFFFNLYFLLVALSQLVPQLRIGYLFTYVGPLVFVLVVTMAKEWHDDHARKKRDREANSQRYSRLTIDGPQVIPSAKIRVGDLVLMEKNQRVPADMVLLRTTESSGACFVRTDQLDGETDWKLRIAVPPTQKLHDNMDLFQLHGSVYADAPHKDIYDFIGNLTVESGLPSTDELPFTVPLGVENTMWANTTLASGSAVGYVIYTGRDTRAAMNTGHAKTKVGILDTEVNRLSKILFVVTLALSLAMVALDGFKAVWYITLFRFLILFSSIIPISLRVNLDMGKSFYSMGIERDREIPESVVRNSMIPEELGRIEYCLTDKTGTLTRNEMELKRIHMGVMAYTLETSDEVTRHVRSNLKDRIAAHELHSGGKPNSGSRALSAFTDTATAASSVSALGDPSAIDGLSLGKQPSTLAMGHGKARRDMPQRVFDMVESLALCHNVTPAEESSTAAESQDRLTHDDHVGVAVARPMSYQASSPDEVAIVKWTELVGVVLADRTLSTITLRLDALIPEAQNGYGTAPTLTYDILHVFPFTSESKRMGIIVRNRLNGDIFFIQKGADAVMSRIVQYNDWLDEECGNMARDGLRTLVIGRKRISKETYTRFESAYQRAKVTVVGRAESMQHVVAEYLENDLELLGLTGVEDRLQDNVRATLELLGNAGIKVWMLTGDKVETATCVAVSAKLVRRDQLIHVISGLRTAHEVNDALETLRTLSDCCLVIDGESLQVTLDFFRDEFVQITSGLSAVVCCRCSPTQKADIVRLIQRYTRKRVLAVGDGGNDVSMIQAADVGVGLVGKEGKQASLAADFSVNQFSFLARLLLWHGRNSYKRSAKLAQFVIHRGLIISIMQVVFSALFYFAPIALFQGMLLVGYTTVYTMAPVFSLVLDRDVTEDIAMLYPELYAELTKGRSLSYKTFFTWLLISIYQGGALMMIALWLFDTEFIHVVSIAFTGLVLNELLMVALEIRTWHKWMIWSILGSLAIYIASIWVLPAYFDISFILSSAFIWKTLVITAVSSVPLYIIKAIRRIYAPPAYAKLT
ncbi:putative aminophospholipid-translocase [Coemansia spiralis]|uniref:Phospholipid-transporting ATPase n=2 Tax=Coemansia TaxID=4863 RepID=A0A9W8G207_9FUNG|nr:putative aminophospholipid-translocase [Coemansia umbellata]KAJ2618993.1 putative aminophospholipid-translocase [Coemansia sp. RSA 1358]KAJ2669531.1 putative aminophospholipid-translocase [Coemansia spiralis]